MKILAFDTALDACSVALWADGEIIAHSFQERRRGHAETLMVMVEDVRRSALLEYSDLDRLAVTVGPGGFTGLRIGLAAARGMALATGLPLFGVTTLEAVAASAAASFRAGESGEEGGKHGSLTVTVILDARRGEVYGQTFKFPANKIPANKFSTSEICGVALTQPVVLRPAEMIDSLAALLAEQADGQTGGQFVAGNGVALLGDELFARCPGLEGMPDIKFPDAAMIAAIAATRQIDPASELLPPSPLYLRAPDAKLPKAV